MFGYEERAADNTAGHHASVSLDSQEWFNYD